MCDHDNQNEPSKQLHDSAIVNMSTGEFNAPNKLQLGLRCNV